MITALGIEPSFEMDGLGAGLLYLLVFGFVFIESGILLGFFLPGDALIFGAGLVAASPHSDADVTVLAVGVTIAAIAGDTVGYWCGAKLGRPWLEGKPKFADHIARTEVFYDRWGATAVVVARWFPWLRTATPVVAGVATMPYRRFVAANVLGAVPWGAGLILLGYYSYEIDWLRGTAIAVGVGCGAAFFGIVAVRWFRRRRQVEIAQPTTAADGGR